jgi:hypothetical protein
MGTRCLGPTPCWASSEAAGGDEVFRDLLLARVIEPTRKADSLRVLEDTGTASPALSSVLCKWLQSLVRPNAVDIRVFNKAGFCESLIYACVAGYLFRYSFASGAGDQQCRM